MQARLRSVRWEADDVNAYELEALPGQRLPPFTAGAHVDVALAPGLMRSYSIANDPAERGRYVLGVLREPEGRGGSAHIHERWRPGDLVEISEPINDFPLDETAPHSVLIAGGVGVTPILSMAARLSALGRPWAMRYVCRSEERAAFLERTRAFVEATCFFGGGAFELAAEVAAAPAGAHLYCCGPPRMIEAFDAAMATRPDCVGHVERFAAAEAPAAEGGYRLLLRRSGKVVDVADGQTMLDAILAAGVDVSFACTNGVCGTCETAVLAGAPDHRDDFLTEDEKASNAKVMLCCSGALTAELELDL